MSNASTAQRHTRSPDLHSLFCTCRIADLGLDVALDASSAMTAPFTGSWFFDEMKGMADATGVSYDKIRRVHMIGELTKGRCSMFGAWGKALADPNGLITLRALDWAMDGPFR